jgi:hypothetical protein
MTRMMKRQLEDELNFERELSIRPPHTTPRADDFSPIHPTVPEMEDTDPQTADVNADDEAEDIPEEKGS